MKVNQSIKIGNGGNKKNTNKVHEMLGLIKSKIISKKNKFHASVKFLNNNNNNNNNNVAFSKPT